MVPPYFPGKLVLSSSDIALLDKQHIRKPTYDHPLPTMSAAEEMDNISVTQIYTGKDDGGEVTFEFNGKHIAVSVFPGYSSQDIEGHLSNLFAKATADDLDKEYEYLVDDILDVIPDAGKAVFRRVAPSPAPSPSGEVLYSLLCPETLYFRLESVNNRLSIVSINSNDAYAAEANSAEIADTVEGDE